MKLRVLLFLMFFISLLPSCAQDKDIMHNGYYSARASSFDKDGWKEFVTLYIHNNKIITVEYNARNISGLVVSWDVMYLSRLKSDIGYHPNQIIREYTNDLLNRQDPALIRRVLGDNRFYEIFKELAAAAIVQAKSGDKSVAIVSVARDISEAR